MSTRHTQAGFRVFLEDDGGVPLRTVLERGPLTAAQAVAIGMGVLAGLRALQVEGLGHGALDTSTVNVSPSGLVRLTGYGLAPFEPSADLAAAGRVLCAALGVEPRPAFGRPAAKLERSRPRLVATARSIAAGGAGRSAAAALMAFGDAAGRIDSSWRIERSMAGLEQLAVPHPTAFATAVDSIMKPVAASAPAPRPPLRRVPARLALLKRRPRPIRVPARAAFPLALVAAGVLTLMILSSMAAHLPTSPARPAAASAPVAAPVSPPAAAAAQTAPPDAVVIEFYRLAAAHQFAAALALWDENLRAALGPAQYPDQRFANTTALTVNHATITSQDSSVAMVATDLTEVTDGVEKHWLGSWRLVKTSGTWLLDQPSFQAA